MLYCETLFYHLFFYTFKVHLVFRIYLLRKALINFLFMNGAKCRSVEHWRALLKLPVCQFMKESIALCSLRQGLILLLALWLLQYLNVVVLAI